MSRTPVCLTIVFVFFVNTGFCSELSVIRLHDGNVIKGNVISLKDGVYTIKTSSLGTMKIKDSEVDEIVKAKNKTASAEKDLSTELESVQKTLMDDEGIMELIKSLQSDPIMQRILDNPEVLDAVNSLDLEVLLKNDDFKKLLTNPTVHEINTKVKGKTEQDKIKK